MECVLCPSSFSSGSSSGSFKQPKLRFDLATFSGTFDTGSFVSELTRDLFEQQDAQDFDPAPFTVLFENALARLNTLRDETDVRIGQYAHQRRDEEAHKENLVGLQEQLGGVIPRGATYRARRSSRASITRRRGRTCNSSSNWITEERTPIALAGGWTSAHLRRADQHIEVDRSRELQTVAPAPAARDRHNSSRYMRTCARMRSASTSRLA
jgi:hypothetical protein